MAAESLKGVSNNPLGTLTAPSGPRTDVCVCMCLRAVCACVRVCA